MVYELYAWYSWLFAVTKLQRLANEWEEKAKKTKELRRGKEMNDGSNNCSYMHLYGSRCTRKSIYAIRTETGRLHATVYSYGLIV